MKIWLNGSMNIPNGIDNNHHPLKKKKKMMIITLDENLKENTKYKPMSRNSFVNAMTDDEHDWRSNTVTKKKMAVSTNLPEDKIYHKGYMEYLETCWNHHLGVVISPDIVWQGLLCELAELVKEQPERYRSLFSESDEKQELIVITEQPEVMPLNLLIDLLKDKVPTNTDIFLPAFSTTTDRSLHAFTAAFCDMCSPYYNYSMMMCGIPFIRLDGTKADWLLLFKCWDSIGNLFSKESKFFTRVTTVLINIMKQFDAVDVDFWKTMFTLEPCGSGSQVEVDGWIESLYYKTLELKYPKNFATHISSVKYKQLNFNKDYDMRVGLFYSNKQEQLLVPDFGFSVMEVLKDPIVEKVPERKLEVVVTKLRG